MIKRKGKTLILSLFLVFFFSGCDLINLSPEDGNMAPEITGDSYIIFNIGDDVPDWKDFVEATDEEDGAIRITDDMVFDNNLNLSNAGIFEVDIYVADSAGKTSLFTITVEVADTLNPHIELIGDAEVSVEVGTEYIDKGIDYNDNDLAAGEVVMEGYVDTSTLGTYTVEYYAIDPSGNVSNNITRTVHVTNQIPEMNLIIADIGYNDVSYTVEENDPNNLIVRYDVVVKQGTDIELVLSDQSSGTFDGLLMGEEFSIGIIYYYDLNDGLGVKTVEQYDHSDYSEFILYYDIFTQEDEVYWDTDSTYVSTSYQIVDGAIEFRYINPTYGEYTALLRHDYTPMGPNTKYIVEFEAKSDVDRYVTFYTEGGLSHYEYFDVTTEYNKYSIMLDVVNEEPNRIVFDLGYYGGEFESESFTLKNFTIKELDSSILQTKAMLQPEITNINFNIQDSNILIDYTLIDSWDNIGSSQLYYRLNNGEQVAMNSDMVEGYSTDSIYDFYITVEYDTVVNGEYYTEDIFLISVDTDSKFFLNGDLSSPDIKEFVMILNNQFSDYSIVDEELTFNITNTGDFPWSNVLSKETTNFVFGESYRWTFKGKADIPRDIEYVVYDGETVLQMCFGRLETTYQTFTCDFIYNSHNNGKLNIHLGYLQGKDIPNTRVYFDDFTVNEIPDINPTLNYFDNPNMDDASMFDWSLFDESSTKTNTMSIIDNALQIEVNDAGGNFWDVSIINSQLKLMWQRTYTFKFDVYSTTTRKLQIVLWNGTDAIPSEEFIIGPDVSMIEFTFMYPSDDLVDLSIHLGKFEEGQEQGIVVFDNFELYNVVNTSPGGGIYTAMSETNFETEMNGYELIQENTTSNYTTLEDGALIVSIDDPDTYEFGSYLWKNIYLEPGTTYMASVRIKSEVERPIVFVVEYQGVYRELYRGLSNSSYKIIEFEFQSTDIGEHGFVANLGKFIGYDSIGSITFDYINIYEKK